MKAILAPLALAVFAAGARADHKDGFFFKFDPREVKFGFDKGGFRASFDSCAPAGHYEMRERRIWCPGYFEQVWQEPVYEVRTFGCATVRICVRPGYFTRVWREGYWKTECVRVWVPDKTICG